MVRDLLTKIGPWGDALETLCVGWVTSSQIIAESYLILAKYFPLSKLHVARFQTYFFPHIWCFDTHINIHRYSAIDLNYIFSFKFTFMFWHSYQHLSLFRHWFKLHYFLQIYIYIHMIYGLLMFLIHFLQ